MYTHQQELNTVPASVVTPEEIRFELERILSSHVFASSARISRFLRFCVEETLAGRAEELKETTIGLAVFDRSVNYDPSLDPIVRVEAGRLREKLSQYYENEGREDSIVIELPDRRYVPNTHRRVEQKISSSTEIEEAHDRKTVPIAGAPASQQMAWKSLRRRRILAFSLIVALAALFVAIIVAFVEPSL